MSKAKLKSPKSGTVLITTKWTPKLLEYIDRHAELYTKGNRSLLIRMAVLSYILGKKRKYKK